MAKPSHEGGFALDPRNQGSGSGSGSGSGYG
jgi:hypothetical protein